MADQMAEKYLQANGSDSPSKINRMKHRQNKKKCMMYPEQRLREIWDIIITIALMMAVITTPLDIAFTPETSNITDNILSLCIDIIFAIDIIIQFNAAYYT